MKESIEFLVSARFSSYTAGFFFEHIFFMRTHHHFFSRSHGTMDHSMVAVYMGFWAAAPKGRCPVEHRGIMRRLSVLPSFRPSVRPSVPPPVDQQGLRLALPGLNLALQASNQPSWLQISLPCLKSALQTSNLPSRPSISL